MSKDLNQTNLIGRLTRDPEIKYTPSGKAVTKFSIANNDSYTKDGQKQDITSFFDITVWGNHAVNCEKYLKKGNQVAISGSLRQNRWTDNNGQNRSKIEVVANQVQFLTPANLGGENQQPQNQVFNDPWQQ